MSRIRILSESMINKIAAGEVVDRPHSVVKELVENSIDAGADRIQVLIKNAGKELISVLDNGCGMSAEEARLCVERHATAKVHQPEDLEKIETLGFRGEALAAISAVSRFELKTCSNESEGGYLLSIEGGKVMENGKIGFPLGTRINVEDLFFNTPARKKFLKSDTTEFQKIQDYLLKTAFSHRNLHLRLTHNKKKIYELPAVNGEKDRIIQIYGSEFAEEMLPFEYEEHALKFSGLFSKPTSGRPSARWQQVFVNDRYIRAPFINHAIKEAYKTILMKHQQPMFFISIYIPPEDIDVNVHPAKTEIRFKNQNLVYTILTQALQKFLKDETRSRFTASVQSGRSPAFSDSRVFGSQPAQAVGDRFSSQSIDPDRNTINFEIDGLNNSETDKVDSSFTPKETRPVSESTKEMATGIAPNAEEQSQESLFHFAFSGEKPAEAGLFQDLKPRWTAIGEFEEYIVANAEGRLLVIDKHAAHERIRFEEIRTEYFSGRVQTVAKAIPEIITLPPQDAIKIENYEEFWKKVGFDIEHFGKNDFSVKAVPAVFQNREILPVIRDVLDEADLFGKAGNMEKYCNQVFERMACHSAIRGKQSMNLQEMQNLLNRLTELDIHLYCPHGRPVVIEITSKELEKRFKRVV